MAGAKVTPRTPRSRTIKTLLNVAAELITLPVAGLYGGLAWISPAHADITFAGFSQFYSLLPGVTGMFLRRAFYHWTLSQCPRDCSIGFGTTFATTRVRIGERTYIGDRCDIGHASIASDVLIGSNVHILSGRSQHYFDSLDVPIAAQGGRYEEVTIGRDVWIGNGAIVMCDVAEQSVVAAGAVVVKPVSARTIVGGNPATVLGVRGTGSAGRS